MAISHLAMALPSPAQIEKLKQTEDADRIPAFLECYQILTGSKPDHLAKAGGRVNLIGEHVDYPDLQFKREGAVHLYSMGGSVQNSYLVGLSKRSDAQFRIWHLNAQEGIEFSLVDLELLESACEQEREQRVPMSKRSVPAWAFHTLGALVEQSKLIHLEVGFDIVLTSNVPHGAGMSNSAANCVALGLAFQASYPELKLERALDLVAFARRSENSRCVGGHCGWLDQLLIVCSQEGQLTRIDYAGNITDHFNSLLPHTWQFAALNTNVPHVLAESEYGDRVQELILGINVLRAITGLSNLGSPSLSLKTYNRILEQLEIASISLPVEDEGLEWDESEISKNLAQILAVYNVPDLFRHRGLSAKESLGIIFRRMRHQKSSALIVKAAGLAVSQGKADVFGDLLNAEGQSLRMSGDFQITGDNGAQDALLDCGFKSSKILGLMVYGRMLGGGGGGNVLFMADRSKEDIYQHWIQKTQELYASWSKEHFPDEHVEATLIEPCLSSGAKLIF